MEKLLKRSKNKKAINGTADEPQSTLDIVNKTSSSINMHRQVMSRTCARADVPAAAAERRRLHFRMHNTSMQNFRRDAFADVRSVQ